MRAGGAPSVKGRGWGRGVAASDSEDKEQERVQQLVRREMGGGSGEGGGAQAAQRRTGRLVVALALALVALLGVGLLTEPWSGARRASGDAELESLLATAAVDAASEGPRGEKRWPESPSVVPASAGEGELNAEAEEQQQPEKEQEEEQEPELVTEEKEHAEKEPAQVHEFPASRPHIKLQRGRGSVLTSCVDKYGAPAHELIDAAHFNPRWPPNEPRPNMTVFVYEAAEVNWLKQMKLTCPEKNLRKMLKWGLGYVHSADLKTALALLEGDGARSFIESGRRTYDPLAADVIVVPLLLSMMGFKTHPRFFKNCSAISSRSWTETAARYLEAQPHYHATAHKHFFVADYFGLQGSNFHPRLVAAMRRGVVATFEGRKKHFSSCNVIPPYVPAQCVGPTAEPTDLPRNASVSDMWFFGGGSYSERPIEFYLRAQMDHRTPKRHRIPMCHAVHEFDKRSGAFSTCCAVPGETNHLTGLVFNRSCSSDDMAACNCQRTGSGWCNELRKARLLIFAPGDTPSSRRAYDAMRYGTVMAVFVGQKDRGYYTHYMPRRVPWSDFTVEVVGVSSGSGNVEDMVGGFFTAANVTADEILCRRKLANDYAAVTDLLAYDGVPAVEWMLESARRECIVPRARLSHLGHAAGR